MSIESKLFRLEIASLLTFKKYFKQKLRKLSCKIWTSIGLHNSRSCSLQHFFALSSGNMSWALLANSKSIPEEQIPQMKNTEILS